MQIWFLAIRLVFFATKWLKPRIFYSNIKKHSLGRGTAPSSPYPHWAPNPLSHLIVLLSFFKPHPVCQAPQHWPLGHVTSSVTWLFDWPWAICYRCSIDTDTLSPKDFEILRLICICVTIVTFLGHVTLSVTWSFFPGMRFPLGVPSKPTCYLELFATY